LRHIFRMTVHDVFFIRGRGAVATSRVESGQLRVGDNIGLLLSSLDRTEITAVDALTSVGGPTIW
jgi:translation elongation factor EF-Tu-like GTPase